MLKVRKTIEIADGVKVEMLFTPRLYSYKGRSGITFETGEKPTQADYLGIYADIMYCAALNAWELDDRGTPDDFPHTRGDFHAFAQADPVAFRDAMDFCLLALTGKGLKDYADQATAADDEVKKKTSRFLGLRSKASS